jgi:hypothetical protein
MGALVGVNIGLGYRIFDHHRSVGILTFLGLFGQCYWAQSWVYFGDGTLSYDILRPLHYLRQIESLPLSILRSRKITEGNTTGGFM